MDESCVDVIALAKAADSPNTMQFLLKIIEQQLIRRPDLAQPFRELRHIHERQENLPDLDAALATKPTGPHNDHMEC